VNPGVPSVFIQDFDGKGLRCFAFVKNLVLPLGGFVEAKSQYFVRMVLPKELDTLRFGAFVCGIYACCRLLSWIQDVHSFVLCDCSNF
jgi:hypothetical protein